MRYEILDEHGQVVNMILASPEFVENFFPGRYRAVPWPSRPVYRMTRRAFLQRFTATEREAIENLRATAGQVRKDKINAFYEYISDGVDLRDSYISACVTALEQFNVLAAGRAQEILTP